MQMMSREGARQKSLERQWTTDFGEAQPAIQQEQDHLMALQRQAGGAQTAIRLHYDFTVTRNIHAGIVQNRRSGARGPGDGQLRARHGGVIPP